MSKKRIMLVTSITLLVIVISLGIVKLYQTYAIGNYAESAKDAINITITEGTSVKVPANGHTDVFYMVSNTNPGTVKYGVAYTTDSNITVKVFSTSKDPASGLIEENEKKYVKLRLQNTSTTEKNTTLSTILGYENGGDLIVQSGQTLVTETYKPLPLLANYITNLYTSGTKTTVTNNDITYNVVESQNLMNDRLGGTTTSLDGGNIRYYGASPNNYIYFNCSDYSNQSSSTCETWRIIGVFDGKVKLMRNESIGQYSWDNKNTTTGAENNYGKNDWTTARLMKLLNPSDYFTVDSNDNGNGQSLYYNSQSGMCFSSANNQVTSCDFTSIGIKNDITRNIIAESTWNLGGWNSASIYSNQMYTYERGTTVYSSRPTTWTGKIALPYPSDYGYAADLSKCSKQLSSYSDSTCTANNWIYTISSLSSKSGFTLFLTPVSNHASFHFFVYNGMVLSIMSQSPVTSGYMPSDTFPTLYLNEKVELKSGNGTESNPYQIGN